MVRRDDFNGRQFAGVSAGLKGYGLRQEIVFRGNGAEEGKETEKGNEKFFQGKRI